MLKIEEDNNIIRCSHGHCVGTVALGDTHILLCEICYSELETQFVTGFLRQTIRQGVESGIRFSPWGHK